ncbi:unnamed protein product [Fructobacillus cardui]|nr:unnamed protein product [Fructobacillus cardui]
MQKNKRLLIETLVFAILTVYAGYAGGFVPEFGFTVSKHEISTSGSVSFLFAILTVISLIRYLYSKFKK